ncbi:hypothetical protein P8C59_001346 [Phyllachora maydis]|uniref:Ribonuclease P protein subunit n=1 Tax=Phyllachora maydis TaxID=1825666 RepID=A0AAD9HXZ9_9PEZI|nr:hypothetical protein P8C59_001346 [Phyllachora maydis]
MARDQPPATEALLARAHSPTTTARILADKIHHRPFLLRPTAPSTSSPAGPPPPLGRSGRRHAREARKQAKRRRRQTPKPAPLSARRRRALGLYAVPRAGQTYATFAPLHALWLGYVRELLGGEVRTGGGGAAAAKLAAADFHGAEVEVVRSRCVSRVGIRGIVVKDSRFVFQLVTRGDRLKIVPKEGTVFRLEIPVGGDGGDAEAAGGGGGGGGRKANTDEGQGNAASGVAEKGPSMVVEVHGNQFMHRPADRATKKVKQRFLRDL